jgi:hypothetical protein
MIQIAIRFRLYRNARFRGVDERGLPCFENAKGGMEVQGCSEGLATVPADWHNRVAFSPPLLDAER